MFQQILLQFLSAHRALLCFWCWSSEAFSVIPCPDYFSELFVDFTELFVVFVLIHLLRALPLNNLMLL